MNPGEQASVPLVGRGYTFKTSGNYLPGEYERLTNLEVSSDGSLKNRLGFTFEASDSPTIYRKFIGNFGPYPIFTDVGEPEHYIDHVSYSTPKLYAVFNGEVFEQTQIDAVDFADRLWDEFSVDGFGPVAYEEDELAFDLRHIQFEGFWSYNDRDYYLVYALIEGRDFAETVDPLDTEGNQFYGFQGLFVISVEREYNLNNLTGDTVLREAIPFVGDTIVSAVNGGTNQGDNEVLRGPAWPTMPVRRHLFQGERVWIATDDTVYFSKATDPQVWEAPSGGFFKFPNLEIKDILTLSDVIYVFCDTAIYVIQYDTDPNVDSEVTLISSNLGGESATAVGDSIFFVKEDTLYAIVSGNIQKVLDLQIPVAFGSNIANVKSKSVSMTSFNNSLYFFYRDIIKGQDIIKKGEDLPGSGAVRTFMGSHAMYTRFNEVPENFTHVSNWIYCLNLDTQSFSVVDLSTSVLTVDATRMTDAAVPIDAYLVTSEGFDNKARLYFMFSFDTNTATEQEFIAFIDSRLSDSQYSFVDKIPTVAGVPVQVCPAVEAKVKDFSPDDQLWMQKKFRSVIVTADLSRVDTSNPQLQVYFGNNAQPLSFDLVEYVGEVAEQNSYRYGLNQRAKKISFSISKEAVLYSSFDRLEDTRFELRDISFFWTPISRGPTNRSADKS